MFIVKKVPANKVKYKGELVKPKEAPIAYTKTEDNMLEPIKELIKKNPIPVKAKNKPKQLPVQQSRRLKNIKRFANSIFTEEEHLPTIQIPSSLLKKRYKEVLSNYTMAIPEIFLNEGVYPDLDFSIFIDEKLPTGFRTEKLQ